MESEVMMESGIISWTTLKNFFFPSELPPTEVLKRGQQKHEMIQNMFLNTELYSYCREITPMKQFKGRIFVGHIDLFAAGKEEFIIYEIKSQRYYEMNRELVLLQIAYYWWLLPTWAKRVKCIVILYTYDNKLTEIDVTDAVKQRKKKIVKLIDQFLNRSS